MANNNLVSNITAKVARVFAPAFQQARVLSRTVDTQMLAGEFTPQFGTTVSIKRPHDYKSFRNATGDITGQTMQIVSGSAPAVVQDYFTTFIDWTNKEEATSLDQLEKIVAPAATR